VKYIFKLKLFKNNILQYISQRAQYKTCHESHYLFTGHEAVYKKYIYRVKFILSGTTAGFI